MAIYLVVARSSLFDCCIFVPAACWEEGALIFPWRQVIEHALREGHPLLSKRKHQFDLCVFLSSFLGAHCTCAEVLRRRPRRGVVLCGCVLVPHPLLMFGFITFCDCKHAERRLFFLVGFVFAGASLRVRICLPACALGTEPAKAFVLCWVF